MEFKQYLPSRGKKTEFLFCLSVIKLIKASNNYETNAIIYYNNDVNDDYNKT